MIGFVQNPIFHAGGLILDTLSLGHIASAGLTGSKRTECFPQFSGDPL